MRPRLARLLLALRRWWFQGQHQNLSRAWTLRHARTGRLETYVVCLDCGREFEYDLAAMRLTGRMIRRPIERPDLVALERAWQEQADQATAERRRELQVQGKWGAK